MIRRKWIALAATFLIAVTVFSLYPLGYQSAYARRRHRRYRTIKIGVIAPNTDALEILEPLFEEIIERDINEYCKKLPRRRFVPRIRFEFLFADAEGSADTHLELVKMFHEMGVDLIIGGAWSGQAAGSMEYVKMHDMLLFSPSSTSPMLADPDNLFRLAPDDTKQAPAIVEMLLSKGIEELIVFQRDDAWAQGLYDAIEPEFESRGGTILRHLVYPPDTTDFTSYLQEAENAAVAATGTVAVELICFSEAKYILAESDGYPTLYDLEWFGSEGTVFSGDILDYAPDQAVHLKVYSTTAAPERSLKFNEMAARYEELGELYPEIEFGIFDIYTANYIDIAWIIAQAVLETEPTMIHDEIDDDDDDDDDDDIALRSRATNVIKVIPDIASRYFGYSGWCLLNEAGDRYATNYEIWGYGMIAGQPDFVLYGYYNSNIGEVIWYTP